VRIAVSGCIRRVAIGTSEGTGYGEAAKRDRRTNCIIALTSPGPLIFVPRRELAADRVTNRFNPVIFSDGRADSEKVAILVADLLAWLMLRSASLTFRQEEAGMSAAEIVDRLAAVCIDSEKRYRHAANDVSRDDLENFFNRQAGLRANAARELQAARPHDGSAKEESGTFAGLLDRVEMDLSVVMSKGDSGVIDWCRQDAEEVAGEYEKALRNPELPAGLRPTVEHQLAAVRDSVAELERLLHAYGGPRS
jgi:uncharacterized protein (TIGR02284 family)